jgi:hypothetical protein
MSLAPGKNRKSWLPLSWGVRFAIAVAGTAFLWWSITSWMRSDTGCVACNTWDVFWILSKLVLIPLLDLLFLLWTVKLLWEQRFFFVQWNRLTDRQQGRFAAIVIAWLVLNLAVYHALRVLHPGYAHEAFFVSHVLFVVIWISSFCWVSRSNMKLGVEEISVGKDSKEERIARSLRWLSVRENRINFLSIFIIVLAFLNPGRLRENLVWSFGLVIFVQVLFRLHHVVLWLTFRGNFDLALYANRLYMHTPGHGDSGEGWILSMAGRYSQALAFYKPQAFDENGKPLLTSLALYMYAINLLNNDEKAAAEALFEKAVSVQEQEQELSAHFRLGLADSLLYQGKEAARARELTARVIADKNAANPLTQQRAEKARIAVFYAYAVASCGEHEEAFALLEESTTTFQGLNKHDLAACEHMRGLIWQVVGDKEQARIAFEATLGLIPYGDVALRSRKRLAELDQKN